MTVLTSVGCALPPFTCTDVAAAALVPFSSSSKYVLCSTEETYRLLPLGALPMARRSALDTSNRSVIPIAVSAFSSSNSVWAVNRGMDACTSAYW